MAGTGRHTLTAKCPEHAMALNHMKRAPPPPLHGITWRGAHFLQ